MFMLILSFILFFISIIVFFLVLNNFFNILLDINFLSFGGVFSWLEFMFDEVSILIMLMLLICFFYVCVYSNHYFGNNFISSNLNNIIYLFVISMFFLVCTGNFFLSLIFWEYLGIVSFFLILFYGNYLSLRSSVITLVSSRFGDVCFFLLIGLSYFYSNNNVFFIPILFLIIITKSAGFPFISWLLEAMRAPTPVSALVHSSTLVAAGVWFTMRYDLLLYCNNLFWISLFLLLTILITGICCFFFIDLKKIVALSTCNNISWCIIYLIYGDLFISLFQLISHGVSKCMLFILIGDIMVGSNSSQNINNIYSPYLYGNWSIFNIFSIVLGLSGVPFISIFFIKHFFLINFTSVLNVVLCLIILSCIFLSYFYSFRLCSILINLKSSVTGGVLFFFNVSLISYFWLFISYVLVVSLNEYAYTNNFFNINLLLFQLMCLIIAYYFYSSNIFSFWCSSLFGCDNITELFYSFFNNISNLSSLFFYRWDNYVLINSISNKNILVNFYSISYLNTIIIIIFLFLMCYYIL